MTCTGVRFAGAARDSGSSQRQVDQLIAGPGVYICDQCVDLCCEALDAEADVGTRPPVPIAEIEKLLQDWVSSIDKQPLEQVREARDLFTALVSQLDQVLNLPGAVDKDA